VIHPEMYLCHLWICEGCGFRSPWWHACGRFPLCTQCEKNQRPADSDKSSKAEPSSSSTAVSVPRNTAAKFPNSEKLREEPGTNIDPSTVHLVTSVPRV
jgi:hypothetical protein